ncbi:MAG: tRNA pseudouridine(55) synthase TruB [Patescibacteria group bacterium]
MQGIHGIYKQQGPTSHDIIKELRKITGIKTIGHAGTLDPQASGVLVVGIGHWATAKLVQEVKKEKEYLAKIKLGETSTTDDRAGMIKKAENIEIPSLTEIRKALINFKGNIKQIPPDFCALNIKGRKAYKIARQGHKPELKFRVVNIKSIRIIYYAWPYLEIKVITGPGVYIRSLARDLGRKLKTGGYLFSLERTRVGDFTKEKSLTLKEFNEKRKKNIKVMSLCFVRQDKKILLGLKKRGFGINRWNGFGGKVNKGEKIEESAARETNEEAGIIPTKIQKKGTLIFEFQDSPSIIEVHVFEILKYNGKIKESEEMKPLWFDLSKIPYENMWPDDRFWLPLFLKGRKFKGEFYFKDIDTLLYHSLREVKYI